MYAIIADGKRQYRVEEGQELDIDYRKAATKGDSLEFPSVLAVGGADGLRIGQPAVSGTKVVAEVLGVQQGPKIFVQKMRRRKNYRRRTGHRQLYTRVRISKIESA
jgi:large subunit ribosomal protein L21